MENLWRELPDDCWEMITVQLGHHREWEQLSLVSKRFLSITNRLRVSLKMIDPSIRVLHKQLQRFPHVRKINLNLYTGPLNEALVEIATSGVKLEELDISGGLDLDIISLKDLGSIKVLKCYATSIKDSDLVVLAEYLPLIEELDISMQSSITDEGIAAMSMKLTRLRIIELSCNSNISDQSLISLSSNCESLTEIKLHRCKNVSQAGISFVMRNSHSYNSLILSASDDYFHELTNPLIFSKSTRVIHLSHVKISDEFLSGIVKADIPLESFHLDNCRNFTIKYIYSVLKAYPSLKSLSLCGADILTDESVREMCQFIRKLSSIKLNSCNKLTVLSFIFIISACPFISNIEMDVLSQEETDIDRPSGFKKNPSITSVTFPSYAFGGLPIFPNLKVLKVTEIEDQPYEVDIAYILKSCHKIRHLTVKSCNGIMFTEEGENEPCNLEWLNASHSDIDDNVLKMVAKRCPKLLYLNLEGCTSVTEEGVREVVVHCGRLRYINLNLYANCVEKDFVTWMASSCSSLREIIITGYVGSMFDELVGTIPYGHIVFPSRMGCILSSGTCSGESYMITNPW